MPPPAPDGAASEVGPADHVVPAAGRRTALVLVQHERDPEAGAAHRAVRPRVLLEHPARDRADLHLVRARALPKGVGGGRRRRLRGERGLAADDAPAVVVRLDQRDLLVRAEHELVREQRREQVPHLEQLCGAGAGGGERAAEGEGAGGSGEDGETGEGHEGGARAGGVGQARAGRPGGGAVECEAEGPGRMRGEGHEGPGHRSGGLMVRDDLGGGQGPVERGGGLEGFGPAGARGGDGRDGARKYGGRGDVVTGERAAQAARGFDGLKIAGRGPVSIHDEAFKQSTDAGKGSFSM